jgi:enoyl-CoA hydratase/carnithine racemase
VTPVLLSELAAVFEELQTEKSIKVVFVTGAGKDFCAGMDLKYARSTLDGNPDNFLKEVMPVGPQIDSLIEKLDKPVIAAVHGNAIAGGFILSYSCDLIIASDDARFGDTHAKWGLVPGWQEPQKLARSIGIRRAKQFFLTTEIISAKEAKEIGLVWKVVPSGKLEEAIEEWGTKFSKLSGIALGMMKEQFRMVMRTDWQTMIEYDGLMRKELFGGFCSTDALERLKTFGKK